MSTPFYVLIYPYSDDLERGDVDGGVDERATVVLKVMRKREMSILPTRLRLRMFNLERRDGVWCWWNNAWVWSGWAVVVMKCGSVKGVPVPANVLDSKHRRRKFVSKSGKT